MKTPLAIKHYRIPQDILLDVLRLMFQVRIKHNIVGVKLKENLAVIKVEFNPQRASHTFARKDLESMLEEYEKYMRGLLSDSLIYKQEEEPEDYNNQEYET